VEDQNNCKGSDTITLSIITYIENIDNYVNIKAYPNPTKGIINISWDKEETFNSYSIYDSYGKLIYNRTIETNNRSVKIDFQKQIKGMYYVKLFSQKYTHTIKVTVE
jgi:hypothetical protein